MSPETWDPAGGVRARVGDVASWVSAADARHVTLAGGEPSEQPEATHALLDCLDPSLRVTLYSGRTREGLEADSRTAVRDLLCRVDLAVLGPYRRDLHAPLLWRGSTNQEIVNISGRVQVPDVDLPAGVMVRLRPRGVELIGVPPEPGAVGRVRSFAAELGADLDTSEEPLSFPFPVF